MSARWWQDDAQLLAALGDALLDPPRDLVEAGEAAYTWRHIDAELAGLTYDSALDEHLAPATRAKLASVRRLSFETQRREATVELEVAPDGLIGQLWPAQVGRVEVHRMDGGTETVPVDEVGGFIVRPIPAGSFRLSFLTAEGTEVVTSWTSL